MFGIGGKCGSGSWISAGPSEVQQSKMDNYQHIAWESAIGMVS